jgi:carboxylesterase type B
MFNKFIVNLILVLSVTIIESNIISVTTKNGIINGIRKTFDGKEFDRFLSIPYAEPPIGDLRFKRPVSAKKWSKPIDASKWPNPCHQHKDFGALFFHNKNFSEDCLYLNIWSPVSNPTIKSKAVLFWIHGGAFQFGSSAERYTGGEVLSTRGDVVVVTINYR